MNKKLLIAASVAVFTLSSGFAQAATVSYTSATVANQETDFYATDNVGLDLQKFNSALGVLNSVTLELTANILGSIQFESTSASSGTVFTDLAAKVSLLSPTGQTLVATVPVSSKVDTVTKYDKHLDFGGTSGRTYDDLSATKTESVTFTDSSEYFALFSGSGYLQALLSAVSASKVEGPGNMASAFTTTAGGFAKVTYDYTVANTPLPGAVWLFGSAMVGLMGFGKRKKADAFIA